jgi:hypothetical protein
MVENASKMFSIGFLHAKIDVKYGVSSPIIERMNARKANIAGASSVQWIHNSVAQNAYRFHRWEYRSLENNQQVLHIKQLPFKLHISKQAASN